jgi:endonuclease YncB( thermonuclease family)
MAGRTETVRLVGIDAPEASPNDRARDQARRMGIPLRELLELGRGSRDFAARLAP